MVQFNANKNLELYARSRIPAAWELTVSDDNVIHIRDRLIEKGKGYQVTINYSNRTIESTIEFEDFAGEIRRYAETQLGFEDSPVRRLFIMDNLSCKKYKCMVSDAFFDAESHVDNWWLSIVFRKDPSHRFNDEQFVDVLLSFLLSVFPYDIGAEEEGAPIDSFISSFERSRKNRVICLAYHGYSCKACGMNLRDKYGSVAKNFIHVHHVNPVATSRIQTPDPINDLIPLCPNCHNVAHLRTPPFSIEEIKAMLNNKI